MTSEYYILQILAMLLANPIHEQTYAQEIKMLLDMLKEMRAYRKVDKENKDSRL